MVYAPSEQHVGYPLRRGCRYAEAIDKIPGDVYAILRPIATVHLSGIAVYGMPHSSQIRNNPGFRLKHPGVRNCSDGSDRTSFCGTENWMILVAHMTGRIAHLPPLLCARNAVTYTHHLNDMYVTLFAGVSVML